jgi:hypothetical protein
MTAHHIKLQSSYGDFSGEFVKQLPAPEKAMTDHGIDPANFVIAKDLAGGPRVPIGYRPDGNPLEYTVFVKGRSFNVTQPDDLSFLAYGFALQPNTKTPRIRPRSCCMRKRRNWKR